MASEISVSLDLVGAFDPAEVTRRLGIVPNKSWRRGEATRLKSVSRKDDGWSVATSKEPSLDLDAQIGKLFAKLTGRFADLGCVREELALRATVVCAVYVDPEDATRRCSYRATRSENSSSSERRSTSTSTYSDRVANRLRSEST